MEYSPTITLEAAGTAEDRVFYLLPVPVLKADLVWQKIKMSACIQSANLTQAQVTCHWIIYLEDPNDTSAQCEGQIAEVSIITSHTALHSVT